ncbi:hypothetical protein SAMN02910355_0278 [Terrisporobacter glycolicus]|nr:hypothetical protein SAMN02910355_0278 [Terrisporobacter glycolicus]
MLDFMENLKAQYTDKSMNVLGNYKNEYENIKDAYNEKALRSKKSEYLNSAKDKLENIKRQYLEQANLEINQKLQEYQEKKDNPPRLSIQEDILEQLKISNNIKQYEAKYKALDGEIIARALLENEMNDEYEFNIAKATAYDKIEDKSQISNLKYEGPIDKQIKEANLYKFELQRLQITQGEYITRMGTDVYEYITGESMSDHFFK